MRCELCGRDVAELKRAIIEGSEMMVCDDCTKYGKVIAGKAGKRSLEVSLKIKRKKEKDIYEEMDKELVPDWAKKIREGRKKKGISREQLGARIGERTKIIAKLENEELHPTDEMVKNLEKELDITLLQEIGTATMKKKRMKELTIGDVIKGKNKN